MNRDASRTIPIILAAVTAVVAATARAQETDTLERKIEALEGQVKELRRQVQGVARSASEFRNLGSTKHFAGYADAGFSDRERGPEEFDGVRFNPAFHYQYQDLILLDAELETSIDPGGATDVELEFATVNLLVHDYAAVFAGRFLSPLGQFRQNLHPSWINKLPSAPVGFGHDQAAPSADVGLGVRGGVPVADGLFNYAVYVGNGPALELNVAGDEIEMIGTEGAAGDADGKKVWGGRIGLFPWPALEIGLSAAAGKIAATPGGTVEAARDYEAQGADLAWQWRSFRLRAEYARQKVADQVASVAPQGGAWKSQYVQGSSRFASTKWEGVVRYGKYRTPHADQDQEQWTMGLNYLFAPNVIAKVAREWNDGLTDTATGDDRWLAQLSYGF